jgi:hypothetical protein
MPPEQRGVYRAAPATAANLHSDDDFVEVVPPSEFAFADRLLDEWLSTKGIPRSDLADDDIRIDIVRLRDGGSAKRYRVRRAIATTPASGLSEPKVGEARTFKIANKQRTNLASEQIDEFLAGIVPSDERPFLVTDQATVFDVTTLDADEIAERCLRKYGFRPSPADLGLPLWQLVAKLRAKNARN